MIKCENKLLDKFYTNNEVVLKVIKILKEYLIINENDLIIEPSAGNGSFLKELEKHYPNKILAYDIKPEYDKIIKQDFLKLKLSIYKKFHFIGNPPFGAQSGLAKKFIKKCIDLNAESISFILAKSFKKESMQNIFPLNYFLITQYDLPTNSFLLNDSKYDVPCVFQIWIKRDKDRKKKIMPLSKYFTFVKITEKPDFSIRRVGFYAGKIFTDCDKSINSHYFIKINDTINKKKFLTLYNNIIFTHNNTVGPRSIAKGELILYTNDLII